MSAEPAGIQAHREVGLATREDIARWHGISVNTVRRWVQTGELPKPIRGRGKQARWRISDVTK